MGSNDFLQIFSFSRKDIHDLHSLWQIIILINVTPTSFCWHENQILPVQELTAITWNAWETFKFTEVARVKVYGKTQYA